MDSKEDDSKSALKVRVKRKVIQRLIKEVRYRREENELTQQKLVELETGDIDKQEKKKMQESAAEAENTFKVTLKALEIACVETEAFLRATLESMLKDCRDLATKIKSSQQDKDEERPSTELNVANEVAEVLVALDEAVVDVPSLVSVLALAEQKNGSDQDEDHHLHHRLGRDDQLENSAAAELIASNSEGTA